MGSRVFDGSGDSLDIDSAVVSGVPFTLGCWQKVDTHSTDGALVGLFDKDAAAEWFFLGVDSSGDVQAEQRSGGSGATQNVRTTDTVTTGTWESAVAVFAALDDRRVFLNGANKGSGTGAEAAPPVDRFSVGRMGDSSPGNYHDGKIQYVFVWDVALSDPEVADFHAGNIPQEGNLVEWWEFDGSSPEIGQISGTQLAVTDATYDGADSPPVTYGGGGGGDVDVAVPAGLMTLGGDLFTPRSDGTVTIPAGTMTLNADAATPRSDGTVTIPAGIVNLGADLFSLIQTASVTVPTGLMTLDGDAFTFDGNATVEAPAGLLTTTADAPVPRSDGTVTVPAGLIALGGDAFSLVSAASVVVPAGLITLLGDSFVIDGAESDDPELFLRSLLGFGL